jgi:hypothetical protein
MDQSAAAARANQPSLVRSVHWVHRAKDGFLKVWHVVIHRKTFITEIVAALFIAALFFISWPAALVACCVVPLVIWIERSKVAPIEKENRELKERNEAVNQNNRVLSAQENAHRLARDRLQLDLVQVQGERDRAKELWERDMPILTRAKDELAQTNLDLLRRLDAADREKRDALIERDQARTASRETSFGNELLVREKNTLQERCLLLSKEVEAATAATRAAIEEREKARIEGKSELVSQKDLLQHRNTELQRQITEISAQRDRVLDISQRQKEDLASTVQELQALRTQLGGVKKPDEISGYLSQLQSACEELAQQDLQDTTHVSLNALLQDFEKRKLSHCQKLQEAIDSCGDDFQRRIPLLGAMQLFKEQSDLLAKMGQMISEKLAYYAGLKTISDRFFQISGCSREALSTQTYQ